MSYGSKKYQLLKDIRKKELDTKPLNYNKGRKNKSKVRKTKSKGKSCH